MQNLFPCHSKWELYPALYISHKFPWQEYTQIYAMLKSIIGKMNLVSEGS
jgi:hypothetical protein